MESFRGRSNKLLRNSSSDLFKTGIHFSLEAHIQHPVCFVYDQVLQTVHLETCGILEMIQKTARSAHQHCAAFSETRFLFLRVFTTHDCSAHHEVEEFF